MGEVCRLGNWKYCEILGTGAHFWKLPGTLTLSLELYCRPRFAPTAVVRPSPGFRIIHLYFKDLFCDL